MVRRIGTKWLPYVTGSYQSRMHCDFCTRILQFLLHRATVEYCYVRCALCQALYNCMPQNAVHFATDLRQRRINLSYKIKLIIILIQSTMWRGKYVDWYTDTWWFGCYIWYSKEWTEQIGSSLSPLHCTKCNSGDQSANFVLSAVCKAVKLVCVGRRNTYEILSLIIER